MNIRSWRSQTTQEHPKIFAPFFFFYARLVEFGFYKHRTWLPLLAVGDVGVFFRCAASFLKAFPYNHQLGVLYLQWQCASDADDHVVELPIHSYVERYFTVLKIITHKHFKNMCKHTHTHKTTTNKTTISNKEIDMRININSTVWKSRNSM